MTPSQFGDHSAQPQQNQSCADSLETRYRKIGIQAVAAAKSVKPALARKQQDDTVARLLRGVAGD